MCIKISIQLFLELLWAAPLIMKYVFQNQYRRWFRYQWREMPPRIANSCNPPSRGVRSFRSRRFEPSGGRLARSRCGHGYLPGGMSAEPTPLERTRPGRLLTVFHIGHYHEGVGVLSPEEPRGHSGSGLNSRHWVRYGGRWVGVLVHCPADYWPRGEKSARTSWTVGNDR